MSEKKICSICGSEKKGGFCDKCGFITETVCLSEEKI